MPSQLHEMLIELFRNRPRLAAELLQLALHVPLPEFTEAQIASSDFTQIQPAEYRADLVVLLRDAKPVFGIVIEVQLSRDARKRLVWPVYGAELRARLGCETCVLVLCADDAVAAWAAQPIELGAANVYRPLVVGPSGVPVVTDEQTAHSDPELAVLSAIAHGRHSDIGQAVQVALAALSASGRLDDQLATLYVDMVVASLSEAARKALQAMDPAKYEWQSDFAKRYVAEGRAEGEAKGRAELVLKLLTLKFGPLPEAAVQRVRTASIEQLDTFAERVLSAQRLEQVLD